MTNNKSIALRLKKFGTTLPDSDIRAGLVPSTVRLIKRNPFAFLVAVAFDRGMPWEKAWQIAAEIDRKGHLDPKRLASMNEDQLIKLLNSLPTLPRYGAVQGAKTLAGCARLVCGQFGGDAATIWKSSSPTDVEKTLRGIHGIGPGIASMANRILHDDFGHFKGKERQIDVNPGSHLLRVFRRAGLIDSESEDQARKAARRLNPEFPAALDRPAWRIGQLWCHPSEPNCPKCELTEVCAKRIS